VAIEALGLPSGSRILDLPCGTGQSFEGLASYSKDGGQIIGVDYSNGMLRRAARRIDRLNLENVRLVRASVKDIDVRWLEALIGRPEVDGILCSLGLTALPDWEAAFDALFALLRPGGRFVLMDVYSEDSSWSTRSVELIARAELCRKAWVPIADRCADFSRETLSTDRAKFGGELYVARGSKAAASNKTQD